MKTYRFISKFIVIILLLIVVAAFMFPIYWTVATSVKSKADLFAYPPSMIPQSITLDHYSSVVDENSNSNVISGKFGKYMVNSGIVAVSACIFSMLIGVPGSYGLVRMRTKNKKDISFWILSTRMLPPIASAIPLYMIFQKLHMINTYPALIIAYVGMNLSFVVWTMQGFFRDIPNEIHEAATVDGCGYFKAFYKIILPLTAPAIVVTLIFIMIFSWNEFTLALVLTGERTKTIPVAIASMWTSVAARWGEMASAAILATLPVLILTFIIQKDMVKGLTFGAIK